MRPPGQTLPGRHNRSRVRVAVVGLGYWGPQIARNLSDIPQAELALLCDLRPANLAAVGSRFPEVARVTHFEDVLSDSSVDAVALVTPVATHYEMAAAALAADKHVFVEKPLAHSVRAASELAATAAKRELVLMPGHTFLYSPPVRRIKEVIDAGEIGEIYFISMSRVNLGLHQPDVSVIWDLAPHDFSILHYWLDERPAQVAAVSRACVIPGTPDVAFINLQFASGAIAHVELSWLSPSKLRRTAIVGSNKMVVYDDTSAEPVRIFDSGASIAAPESFGEYRLTYRTGDILSPKIDATEPLSLELEDFCAAILGTTEPRSTPQLAIEVLRTIEAVDRSLGLGGAPVAIKESADYDASDAPPEPDAEPSVVLLDRVKPAGGVRQQEQSPFKPSDRFVHDHGDRNGTIGTAVLGAGPAGLTAAYLLGLRGEPGAVFEAEGSVGGIAKTIEFNGFRFDLGGHRFFTKLEPIRRLWEEIMGDDFLTRPRLSRIYYNGNFFAYPLEARGVIARLGLWESVLCGLSYLWSLRLRGRKAETFEDWITMRFGARLYDVFFRSYTEKVWGIPGSEIRAKWAAQRIKNFSFWKAVLSMAGLGRDNVTTLIEEFQYPRLGPGQMWEALQERVERMRVPVHLNQRCVAIRHDDGRVRSIVVGSNGTIEEHSVDRVLSSIPLNELVLSLVPAPPEHVQAAARRLRYRDFCIVALMTTEEEPFADNWIYLHDPSTRAGRVQNYGAWSDGMVRPGTTCLGVEYFCFRGDDIWEMSDDEAVELAKSELGRIGLIDPDKVFDGVKVLVPNAYPMYDQNYEDAVEIIRGWLEGFENLQTFGRNGLHRYNNQDHSMWTAILATLNLLDRSSYDVWSVNTEEAYLEEGEVVDAALNFDLTGIGRWDLETAARVAPPRHTEG
jgi:protoporphyrinogen oxidase/predicted dehydrogenase